MSSRQLFRQEALDFQRVHHDWGTVSALQPKMLSALSWLVVASAIAISLFVLFASYARKETAIGYLTPSTGTAKIFTPRASTIRKVHVHEGDKVAAGDMLLSLDMDQLAGDGSDVNAALIKTMEAQTKQLSSTIAGESQRTKLEHARLKAVAEGLKSELWQLDSQLKVQNERLELVEKELAAGTELAGKGYMTAVELRKRQLLELEQKQAASAISQRIAAKKNELKETESNLSQLPTVMQERVQTLRNQLAEVQQRATEVEGRRAQVIRSPIAGRVATVQAKAGQSADPTRLQMEIVPENSQLQAELFVPARAIGFVEVGQPVRILYDAFPYQQFGAQSGKVTSVSQTVLSAGQAGGPFELKQPAYRVIASLDRPTIDVNGKPVALQPDMLLKGDIILERRSLASWLIEPLRSVRM